MFSENSLASQIFYFLLIVIFALLYYNGEIDFQFEAGTSTLFAYEDSGKYYVEQPYQGIYKIDSQLYSQLQETN